MNNTTLINILRTFTSEEIKKFEEMLRSPYYNKQTPLVNLFEQIRKYYPDFKDSDLRKDIVYQKMFPDKKYNYGTMKNLIYELQKLSETFITIQELEKDRFETKNALIKSMRKRNLNILSDKNLKELEKEISGNELGEEKYFLKLHFVNKLKQNSSFERTKGNVNINIKGNMQKEYSLRILETIKHIKKYYLLDTLRSYNRIITNKNILDASKVIEDCEDFINSYPKEEFEDISLNLELNFLKMNLGKITDEEFMKFKELVTTDLYKMNADKEISYAFSIYILNYCRIKNQTDKTYKLFAFEIIKSLSENDNFKAGSEFLNLVLIRNFIIIGTQLNEFQWCENFLKKYIERIHPDYREDLTKFYYTHKYFYQNKFGQSLEQLSGLNFDDIFNKNYIKEFLVMNYYELKYFDLLDEQLNSFKKFLSNNNALPESYRTQCTNFVNYLTKLFLAASGKKTDLIQLKDKIQNEKNLIFKDWFIKKLEELG